MLDLTQLLLGFIILVLTAMLAVIGIQVYFILGEFRQTLSKANKVLDDTGVISESVSKPVGMISGILMGLRGSSEIAKIFSRKKKNE